MPSGFSALDTSFPDLNGKGTEESIQIVTDYLYQLLEQLRYMLHNLGTRNFNQTELGAFASSISEPIHIALQEEVERAEGAEATLQTNINIEANRITAEVSRAEGAESALSTRITQTADAITAEVTRATTAEGTLQTRITQNADAISAEVTRASGAEGVLGSRITQNADAITAEVTRATTAEGSLGSRITQTASDITAEVSRATGAESAIQQSADAIKAQVTDGQGNYTVLNLKSDGLHIGSAAGTTTINGGSITANSIGAQQIAAGSITATEIAGRTITATEIATGTITANEIAANTITAAEIAANTITGNKIAANVALSAPVIAGGSITSAEIYGGGYHDIDGDATLDITSFSGFTALLYGPAGMQSIADAALGVYSFGSNHIGHFYIGGTKILTAGGTGGQATTTQNMWTFRSNGIAVPYGTAAPDSSTPGYGTLGALYFKI